MSKASINEVVSYLAKQQMEAAEDQVFNDSALTKQLLARAAAAPPVCPECRRKPVQEGYDVCFRCRVSSVGFSWHGGGFNFGRKNFSERTNAEFVNEHVGDVRGDPNIAHLGSKERL